MTIADILLRRYADGALKTIDVASTRSQIASLLEKYRKSGDGKNIVHVCAALTPLSQPFLIANR